MDDLGCLISKSLKSPSLEYIRNLSEPKGKDEHFHTRYG
jgi:hypothetical protein